MNDREKRMIFRSEKKYELLESYITSLYENFKDHFDSGDLIFTGGVVNNILGIDKKNSYKDLDICIIKGDKGDLIENEIIEYLQNSTFEGIVRIPKNKSRNVMFVNKSLCIDFFRNEHPKQLSQDVEIRPGIITKFFGHEWFYGVVNKDYLRLLEIEPKNKRLEKVIKNLEILLNKIKTNGNL